MNRNNAQYIGRKAGKEYQEYQRANNLPLTQESYRAEGKRQAPFETRYVDTQSLYIKGWNEMWREPEPSKVIEHNPNSRFCSCPDCMKG